MMQMTAEWGEMPSHWSVYIVVTDLDATLARSTTHGGTICVQPFNAPGVGRIARIDEPGGAGAYLIQLEAHGDVG
jgi:predicted enzyme related to lactoylglutathione lyase